MGRIQKVAHMAGGPVLWPYLDTCHILQHTCPDGIHRGPESTEGAIVGVYVYKSSAGKERQGVKKQASAPSSAMNFLCDPLASHLPSLEYQFPQTTNRDWIIRGDSFQLEQLFVPRPGLGLYRRLRESSYREKVHGRAVTSSSSQPYLPCNPQACAVIAREAQVATLPYPYFSRTGAIRRPHHKGAQDSNLLLTPRPYLAECPAHSRYSLCLFP